MNRKIIWLSVLFLTAIGLSIFLMLTNNLTPTLGGKNARGTMNAYMTHATYTQYNQQGQLHSHIDTPKMEHFKQNNASYFIQPKVLIYTENRIPWHATAKYGSSIHGNQTVHLWDHVILMQPQVTGHPETTILTSAMTVFPKQSLAKSKQNVTIKQPGSIMHGKGMNANLKTGFMELLSHSRGIYVPKNKKKS